MPDNGPPLPSELNEALSSSVTDPKTGKSLRVADLRDEFARLTEKTPRDFEAERAFIASKLEMIDSDPRMSAEEKKAAREQLLRIGR
jgi:hypothetical protein